MKKSNRASKMQKYTLPKLPYAYDALAPHISEKQLTIHHDKHHQGYVNKTNKVLEELEKARKQKRTIDMKAALKNLSFNLGGHVLHSLFWPNLAPPGKGGKPEGGFKKALGKNFGSVNRFKKEFTDAAAVEGSGWVALAVEKKTKRMLICQIEKHNLVLYPNFEIIMVLDVWEHAFYLDYQNDKGKFIENFWHIVNWKEVNKRFLKIR